MAKDEQFVFVPLGGVGEIGMNLAMYGFGPEDNRSWIVVDFGMGFARDSVPGVDLIYPDIRFLEHEKKNVLGIILTHAHEDHYGALVDLWKQIEVPVYATPFTAAMLEAKVASAPWAGKVDIRTVAQNVPWTLGPFELEMVPVSHSIPEPNAVAIRTKAGLAIHTGDWKLDETPGVGRAMDENRFRELGEEGVLALICDSTNAMREGISPSEADVTEALTKFISEAPHRVAVTSFSSNFSRMKTIMQVAEKVGRKVIMVGRSMHRVAQVAADLGYMSGVAPLISEDDFKSIPRKEVLILCTGSQGEERASVARMANDTHRSIKFSSGDRVIFSSRTIPGNEISVNTVINSLADSGIEVITDKDGLIHVSGHPRKEELKEFYSWLKPQTLIPVHGEPMHLAAHAEFARSQDIPNVVNIRNGHMVLLNSDNADVIDQVASGRLYKDGKLVVAPELSGVTERVRLSDTGMIAISLAVSTSGQMIDEPLVDIYGLPENDRTGASFEDIIIDEVDHILDNLPLKRKRDAERVEKALKRGIQGKVRDAWGKKPFCSVMVHIVGQGKNR